MCNGATDPKNHICGCRSGGGCSCQSKEPAELKVFLHHIYEYTKGLRNLVLFTGPASHVAFMEQKLTSRKIAHVIHAVSTTRVNVFFGHDVCVEVVRSIGTENLRSMTPEADFLLGIMLGYDRLRQCERYLERASMTEKHATVTIANYDSEEAYACVA